MTSKRYKFLRQPDPRTRGLHSVIKIFFYSTSLVREAAWYFVFSCGCAGDVLCMEYIGFSGQPGGR